MSPQTSQQVFLIKGSPKLIICKVTYVYLEEVLSGALSVLGGHDEDRHGAVPPSPALLRHGGEPLRALQLDLVERLARRQTDVVHPLWVKGLER